MGITPESEVLDAPTVAAIRAALRIAGEELAAADAAVSALQKRLAVFEGMSRAALDALSGGALEWERLMQYGMLLEVAEKCDGIVREVARDEIRRRDAERKAGT